MTECKHKMLMFIKIEDELNTDGGGSWIEKYRIYECTNCQKQFRVREDEE